MIVPGDAHPIRGLMMLMFRIVMTAALRLPAAAGMQNHVCAASHVPHARLVTARARTPPAHMNFLDEFAKEQADKAPDPFDGEPCDPNAPLGPGEMVDAVCRALQDNGRSPDNEGYALLYQYMTPQGRTYVAPPPPRNGRLDGVSFEFFLDNACDPVLSLIGCDYYTVVEVSQVPATMTRGGLGTVKVRLASSLNKYLASQRCTRSEGSASIGGSAAARVPLGSGDKVLQALVDEEEEEGEDVDAAMTDEFEAQEPMAAIREGASRATHQQSRTLLFGLEQQRRPPLEGVWLIKEVLPLEQTLFQVINKGSTEDW